MLVSSHSAYLYKMPVNTSPELYIIQDKAIFWSFLSWEVHCEIVSCYYFVALAVVYCPIVWHCLKDHTFPQLSTSLLKWSHGPLGLWGSLRVVGNFLHSSNHKDPWCNLFSFRPGTPIIKNKIGIYIKFLLACKRKGQSNNQKNIRWLSCEAWKFKSIAASSFIYYSKTKIRHY